MMTVPFFSVWLFLCLFLQAIAYADAEDAEFQLGADLEERGGMARCVP